MNKQSPILLTGAAGEVGSVSGDIARRLIKEGYPVRAFVRSDDDRAEALRQIGADVFVGDLLNLADVVQALKGCQRIFFTMSLSPYYLDANLIMIAAALEEKNIEVFVNISEIEQSYMTFEHMSAPKAHRLKWLGGLVDNWSPQQRAHWLAEQALKWSGLPAVHLRATIFVENPLLTWIPLKNIMEKGELNLPFADAKLSPIAAADVAEVCTNILIEPPRHIGHAYALTGPELISGTEMAQALTNTLGYDVLYVTQSMDDSDKVLDNLLAERSAHTAAHLKVLTRLIAGGRYEEVTDTLETLLGHKPTMLKEALASNERVLSAKKRN